MAKKIILNFRGYVREVNKHRIPEDSGVYLVYDCKYNRATSRVSLYELIYIGEAGDARERIRTTEKKGDWRAYAGKGYTLCYAFARAEEKDRVRAQAALIHYHKPRFNTDYVDSFPFPDTTIESNGRCRFIESPITVYRSP